MFRGARASRLGRGNHKCRVQASHALRLTLGWHCCLQSTEVTGAYYPDFERGRQVLFMLRPALRGAFAATAAFSDESRSRCIGCQQES
jgi:hypothetical protein